MTRKLLAGAVLGALLLTAACSKNDTASTPTSSTTTTTTAGTTTTTGTTPTTTSTTTTSAESKTTTTTAGSGKTFTEQVAHAKLPETVTTCLADKSAADASFKAIVESKDNPTLAQAKQVVPVILSCMTKAQFAAVLLAASSSPVPAAAAECITTMISGLSDDDLAGMSANDTAVLARVDPQLAACMSPASGATTTTA